MCVLDHALCANPRRGAGSRDQEAHRLVKDNVLGSKCEGKVEVVVLDGAGPWPVIYLLAPTDSNKARWEPRPKLVEKQHGDLNANPNTGHPSKTPHKCSSRCGNKTLKGREQTRSGELSGVFDNSWWPAGASSSPHLRTEPTHARHHCFPLVMCGNLRPHHPTYVGRLSPRQP